MRHHKNKVVRLVTTKTGFTLKAWINRATGGILPTHWRVQAIHLGRPEAKAAAARG